MRLTFPTLSASELCSRPPRAVIDLRSPAEFAEDHVPGAVNVPLFDDVQRALVGTLYARSSPEDAFQAARDIVRGRIGMLVAGIAAATGWTPRAEDFEARVDALTGGGFERTSSFLVGAEASPAPAAPVVFHCWRGGLRSRSVLHFVRELGFTEATLLAGGYKAYRAEVARHLAGFQPPPAFVLRGLTGVGKTLVLREIERRVPELVIDLEALAGHRSSLLGMVGLEPCSQKEFETRLAERLRRPLGPFLVLEGESRKVGDAIVPPALWRALDEGESLELVAGVERRVEVLAADYLASARARDDLRRQLPLVEARMPRKHVGAGLVTLLDAGRTDELVRLLLEHYYDPLYRHSEKGRSYAERFDATDPRAAAEACLAWCRARAARPTDTGPGRREAANG
ncbi:MAG: tRNA 2-selenouridine(34) synthase MnmH [Planctomycetes bacterium]|nr:tRNA 2-selenouridine(34) synthase MnmH [Planctomycetota bacterium]